MRINNLIPENTEGFGGKKPPSEENSTSNAKKTKRETAVSQRLINFALLRSHRDRYVGSLFVANQWYLSVCHEVHIYIKGWLPSHINVAVTANEMREGISVSVCRHRHQTLCKLL